MPPRLRLRELFGLERLAARNLALEWGYPREIHEQELLLGHWFEWGPDGLFWICPHAYCEPGEAAVHAVTRPGSHLGLRFREWMGLVVLLGDLLGLFGYVLLPDPKAPLAWPVFERSGWTKRDGRWYLSLRESPPDAPREAGDAARPAAEHAAAADRG